MLSALDSDSELAIDESNFKAVNHRDKNLTAQKMKTRQARAERHIARHLAEPDEAEHSERAVPEAKIADIKAKLEAVRKGAVQLERYDQQLAGQPEVQLSLTGPDARSMKSAGKDSGVVGYNAQTAVDTKHHLIVAHEVTNVGTDRTPLYSMAQHARRATGI